MKCCICGEEIKGMGNNPEGAMLTNEKGELIFPKYDSGCKCCDECHNHHVIPGRLHKLKELK